MNDELVYRPETATAIMDELPKPIVEEPAEEPKVEVLVWAKPFREAVFLATAVNDEPTLTFAPASIGIRVLDVSEVSMIDLSLIPADIRALEAGSDWKKRVTVKARDILTFLPKLGKKDAHEPLRFVVDGNLLAFEFGSMTLEVKGFKPERELPLPKVSHTVEAIIPVKDVLDFIKKAKGTTDRVVFSVGRPSGPALSASEHVLLSAGSDYAKMTARIDGDITNNAPPEDDSTRATYDIGRLQLLFDTVKKVAPYARVKWAKDLPLMIEPIIEGGSLTATFYLASLMES